MGGSAKVAKRRIEKVIVPEPLGYPEWMRRVRILLKINGLEAEKLTQYDFRTWHGAGVRAGYVAELIVASEKGRPVGGRV